MRLVKPMCGTCIHWNHAPELTAKMDDGSEVRMGACSGEPPKVILVPTQPPPAAMIQAARNNAQVHALEARNFRPYTAEIEPACRMHQEMVYLLDVYADVRIEHPADAALQSAFGDATSAEEVN